MHGKIWESAERNTGCRASMAFSPPVASEKDIKISKACFAKSYLDMFKTVAGQKGWPKEMLAM